MFFVTKINDFLKFLKKTFSNINATLFDYENMLAVVSTNKKGCMTGVFPSIAWGVGRGAGGIVSTSLQEAQK